MKTATKKKEKPKDVDTYIAEAKDEAIPLLEEIRGIIKKTIPKAEESISWNVPFYKYYGGLAGIAAYKNHVGVGFATGRLETEHREELEKKGYSTGLKTFQIRFDQKVPAAVLKQILKTKARENEIKKEGKK
jgi:uncharacterized protein